MVRHKAAVKRGGKRASLSLPRPVRALQPFPPLLSDNRPTLGAPLYALEEEELNTALIEATKRHTTFSPHDWQLRISRSTIRKRDVVCIAGTSRGKTLPFVMPCFADPDAMVIIVSPLNALENDQVRSVCFFISLSSI